MRDGDGSIHVKGRAFWHVRKPYAWTVHFPGSDGWMGGYARTAAEATGQASAYIVAWSVLVDIVAWASGVRGR